MADARPSVLFLGSTYVGHATRFANLRRHSADDPRIRASYQAISGWNHRGLLERAPLIPAGLKGRTRAVVEARHMATVPRPDVIWTSGGEELAVYIPLQQGPFRRPVIFDLDATDAQLESMAPHYFHRPSKAGFRRKLSRFQERLIWSPVTLFTPWSNWAADGLRAAGVSEERIRVAPPGISLEQWAPDRSGATTGSLRLLFVGGDFVRKGGRMLLDVFRTFPTGELVLDIVTRDDIGPLPPGIRLHRAEPNSEALRTLCSRAELFVLPTVAECFGLATIEAMASGLPVIVSDIGGSRDIVDPGETGWLIEPTAQSLATALQAALSQRKTLQSMGRRARAVAISRFDGVANDRLIVDWCLELAEPEATAEKIRGAFETKGGRG